MFGTRLSQHGCGAWRDDQRVPFGSPNTGPSGAVADRSHRRHPHIRADHPCHGCSAASSHAEGGRGRTGTRRPPRIRLRRKTRAAQHAWCASGRVREDRGADRPQSKSDRQKNASPCELGICAMQLIGMQTIRGSRGRPPSGQVPAPASGALARTLLPIAPCERPGSQSHS